MQLEINESFNNAIKDMDLVTEVITSPELDMNNLCIILSNKINKKVKDNVCSMDVKDKTLYPYFMLRKPNKVYTYPVLKKDIENLKDLTFNHEKLPIDFGKIKMTKFEESALQPEIERALADMRKERKELDNKIFEWCDKGYKSRYIDPKIYSRDIFDLEEMNMPAKTIFGKIINKIKIIAKRNKYKKSSKDSLTKKYGLN